MDKIADSFLAEVRAKENGSVELANQNAKAQQKTYKHPMAVDIFLAFGLLFAMAGLTVSFVKGLTTHSAKTNIMQGNYKAAIGILRSSPIPEFFGGTSADNSEDLLNQALYLDAMTKLDADRDDKTAVQELTKISTGSRFYDLAQDQLRQLSQPDSNTPATSPSATQSPEAAAGGDPGAAIAPTATGETAPAATLEKTGQKEATNP